MRCSFLCLMYQLIIFEQQNPEHWDVEPAAPLGSLPSSDRGKRIGKHIGNPQLGNRSLPLSALAESITTWGAGQGGQGAEEGFSLRSFLNAPS